MRGGGRPQREKECLQKEGEAFSPLLTRGGAGGTVQSETCRNPPIRDGQEKLGEADRKLSK